MQINVDNKNKRGRKPVKIRRKKPSNNTLEYVEGKSGTPIIYPKSRVPTFKPIISEPELTYSIIFYSNYQNISPGTTAGQGRPIFRQNHRLEKKELAPKLTTVIENFIDQIFPLKFTLRTYQLAGAVGKTTSQTSNETKLGFSEKLKLVIESSGIPKVEGELGSTQEYSVRDVVQFFHDGKRIADLAFEETRINQIYKKIISGLRAKNPFIGNVDPLTTEFVSASLYQANTKLAASRVEGGVLKPNEVEECL